MPTEDRRIIFDNNEVYKAIYALCHQKQLKKPPAGQINDVSLDPKDTSKVIVNLINPQEKTQRDLEYSRDFLAAALMLFCRGCGIPLPKGANKSVVIDGETVILRIKIEGRST